MTEKERRAHVRQIKKHLLTLLRDGMVEGRDLDVLGAHIAEIGANLCDEAKGRTASFAARTMRGPRAYRKTTTYKVRKALGYSYP